MDKEKFILDNYIHIKSYVDKNDNETGKYVIAIDNIQEFIKLFKINLIKLKHDEYTYKNICEIIDELSGDRLNGTIV